MGIKIQWLCPAKSGNKTKTHNQEDLVFFDYFYFIDVKRQKMASACKV